jgi:NAD(P)-dependent dehydrogenase (short-subunit alcohol dehydrogenase family)
MGILDGRVAIVTGGGRGIGRSHCLELARHGAAVVVTDPGVGVHGEAASADDADRPADSVVAEIEACGGTAVADHSSVTDWAACAALVQRAVDTFGRLDVVVNNAGIVRDRMITSMAEDDWDAVLAVHLKGTFAMTKHACDHWRSIDKAGGTNNARIVNTTSGTGLRGNVGQSAYGAAKAGIANLTMITALEMARYDVTANAISPVAATRMTATVGATGAGGDPDPFDPMDPGNSSPVVAYLASEGSSWLTGQVLRVQGNVLQRYQTWDALPGDYVAAGGRRLEASELGDGLRRLYGAMPVGLDAGKSLGTSGAEGAT